jgi:SAM-dependent methyltransferase
MFDTKHFRRFLKRKLPAPVTSILKKIYYSQILPLTFRELSDADRSIMDEFGISKIPPASLRFRVNGTANVRSYLDAAKSSAEAISRALALAGTNINTGCKVLDFGCGSGRTLLWWLKYPDLPDLYGVDIDEEAVAWIQKNLPVKAAPINTTPPLPYPANYFDAIYCISVFTHLDQEFHRNWLRELHRVVRNGALVLASVHSGSAIEALPTSKRSHLNDHGFLFQREEAWDHVFPKFYQTAYQTPEYIAREWGELFQIIERLTLWPHQDLVVMRKPK